MWNNQRSAREFELNSKRCRQKLFKCFKKLSEKIASSDPSRTVGSRCYWRTERTSSTSRGKDSIECVRKLLRTDRWLSVMLIFDLLDMSKSIVNRIVLDELFICKVCAKLVPKVLNDVQKHGRELRRRSIYIYTFLTQFSFLYIRW